MLSQIFVIEWIFSNFIGVFDEKVDMIWWICNLVEKKRDKNVHQMSFMLENVFLNKNKEKQFKKHTKLTAPNC